MNDIVRAENRPEDRDPDTDEQPTRSRSKARRRRRRTGVPTREDCLRRLAQLPGLVAMKILTPAESEDYQNARSKWVVLMAANA